MNFRNYVQSYADFPKPGVLYWDFSGLLSDGSVFASAVDKCCEQFGSAFNKIAAIESKGFSLGGAIAYKLKKPLVLIRKPHLTPGRFHSTSFVKEYGHAEYQVKDNTFSEKDRVLVVYDILALEGASEAAIHLIEKQGATVIGLCFAIELNYLQGRKKLEDKGYPVFSLIKIEDKK